MLNILLALVLLGFGFLLAELVRFHLWFTRSTKGAAYFGLPSAGRRAFAEEMRLRAPISAAVWALFCRLPFVKPPSLPRLDGIGGPPHCDRAGFERAKNYPGARGDVFVVTQMKCGTTWMLQLAYEVAMRGRGDLSDDGHRHIHAVCPWIESTWAVAMQDAPRLGDRGLRIIKSHMPAQLLAIRPEARYIYVTRHPVPCFGSCVDFIGMLAGPIAGTRAEMLDWFCSERMWWGHWADHVEGWWKASRAHPNVLFVHFEEMTADLPGVVDRVARFLDVALTPAERDEVIRKSRFDYMKEHEERFSMSPPSLFAPDGEFLKKGAKRRDVDEGGAERERIVANCRQRLRGGEYAKDCFYPDLAS